MSPDPGKATTVLTGRGDIELVVFAAQVASFICLLAFRHFVCGAKSDVFYFFCAKIFAGYLVLSKSEFPLYGRVP